jgi:large subunit ribosomal protein L3
MAGLLGRKLGMTQHFDESGNYVPISVIEAGPCPVVQVKKVSGRDGYEALQLGFGTRKHPTKALGGHTHIANLAQIPQVLKEFPFPGNEEWSPGKLVTVALFKAGEMVKVTGVSKGRGTAGVVKRHHFAGGPKSHGQTDRHRHAGSIGTTSTPGHVLRGKRMAGHMGMERVSIKNLMVIRVDEKKNILFIRGAVPGPANGIVWIEH